MPPHDRMNVSRHGRDLLRDSLTLTHCYPVMLLKSKLDASRNAWLCLSSLPRELNAFSRLRPARPGWVIIVNDADSDERATPTITDDLHYTSMLAVGGGMGRRASMITLVFFVGPGPGISSSLSCGAPTSAPTSSAREAARRFRLEAPPSSSSTCGCRG